MVMLYEENGILIKNMKWIQYSKDELTEKLMRENSIHAPSNKTEVEKVFQENSIPMKYKEEDKKQGWDGKPKYML